MLIFFSSLQIFTECLIGGRPYARATKINRSQTRSVRTEFFLFSALFFFLSLPSDHFTEPKYILLFQNWLSVLNLTLKKIKIKNDSSSFFSTVEL